MNRTLIKDTINKAGETVLIKGWVNIRRDHGKLIFLDIRDRSGLIQVVVNPKISEEAHRTANELRNEFVVELEGKINPRQEKQINPNIETGKVELEVTKLTILSKAKALPFEVNEDTLKVNEEARMKYRYLDLRSERMQRNLRLRDKVTTLVREYMHKNDFVEIETPMLTKSSPEGARDFLVPSRLQPGKFYALPQAPQQYKQLLMIAGLDRYFQLARAMRDEDLRGDRQLEHTQIDLEMSFVKERDVLDLVEGLMIHVAEACGKKVLKKPFPVFTHEEAVKQFGADKFDLRGEDKDPGVLAFAWVVDFPLLEWDEDEKKWTFAHNPFSAPKAEHVEKLLKGEDLGSLRAQQYDLVCNGFELASGGVRISDPNVQRKVFELMGLTPEQTEERFGHLINAYEYGAPPHAGMAPGLDRLVMLLAGEENIREVNAFPVNSSGQTSVMDAPSTATDKQLKELHIKVELPKSKEKK
ncbi:MAG TPA: aspartate--tRNA ligase [Patescibacteria group bacterium]